MKAGLERVKALARAAAKAVKVHKRLTLALAVVLVIQLYFVRELIAAELLFGLGFLVLMVIVGVFYLVGFVGERSFDLMEAGARGAAPFARRGYAKVEELSKKQFRHPGSESVQ
jgi:hypothetical protein